MGKGATSKGGAGKTTSTIILATTLSRGTKVRIIDVDPENWTAEWAEAGTVPNNLVVTRSEGGNEIQDEIDRARARATFVILDLEGTSTEPNSLIMAESDLIIIPMSDKQQDAKAAVKTLREVRRRGRAQRRGILRNPLRADQGGGKVGLGEGGHLSELSEFEDEPRCGWREGQGASQQETEPWPSREALILPRLLRPRSRRNRFRTRIGVPSAAAPALPSPRLRSAR